MNGTQPTSRASATSRNSSAPSAPSAPSRWPSATSHRRPASSPCSRWDSSRSAGLSYGPGPSVAAGQFIIALNFAEVTSHYPLAGSVFQWTKYMASRTYSWFTGWIYLFAGILTVTAVVATLPLALIPALNGLGWHSLQPDKPAHRASGRADHPGGDHCAQHLRCQARRHHQQHRRGVRDPRHVRVRPDPDDLPQSPGPPASSRRPAGCSSARTRS